MKTTKEKLPFGHPDTLRDMPGGHPCKGFEPGIIARLKLTREQENWYMNYRKNKP